MDSKSKQYSFEDLLQKEDSILKQRREKLFGEEAAQNFNDNSIGLALSGENLTSTVLNLGFLKRLCELKLINYIDYFSMASVGGLAGTYIATQYKKHANNYTEIFNDSELERMFFTGKNFFDPGDDKAHKTKRGANQSNMKNTYFTFVLNIEFILRLFVYLLSPCLMILYTFFVLIFSIKIIGWVIPSFSGLLAFEPGVINGYYNTVNSLAIYLIPLGIATVVLNSRALLKLVSMATMYYLLISLSIFALSLFIDLGKQLPDDGLVLFCLCFITSLSAILWNPNYLGYSKIYKWILKNLFFHFNKDDLKKSLASFAYDAGDAHDPYLGPYPIYNAIAQISKKYKYDFIFTPISVGSKMLSIINSAFYAKVSIMDATYISSSKSNVGSHYNLVDKIFSFISFFIPYKFYKILVKFLNIDFHETPIWLPNPKGLAKRAFKNLPAYWPLYYFNNLFGNLTIHDRYLKVGEASSKENLAAFELLKRKCKLIICLDSGPDPKYSMAKIENLSIRARNELKLRFEFRDEKFPASMKPSHFNNQKSKRFAIADIFPLSETGICKDDQDKIITNDKGQPIKYIINFNEYLTKENVEHPLVQIDDFMSTKSYDINIFKDKIKSKYKVYKTLSERMEQLKQGVFVFIKPQPQKMVRSSFFFKHGKSLKERFLKLGFKYKLYHDDFPHENMEGKFLNESQWAAYFTFGYQLCNELVGLRLSSSKSHEKSDRKITHQNICNLIDSGEAFFEAE